MTQQSLSAKAVICREVGQPVVVETVSVEPPRRGEVMIKLAACGVCHSDLSATNGTLPLPPPVVLGHEGAGASLPSARASANSPSATTSSVPSSACAANAAGARPAARSLCDQAAKAAFTLPDGTTRFKDAAGQPLNIFSGCGVMAEYATLHTDNVVKIDAAMPLDKAALIGCGVMTGVGAAVNTAKVEPGSATVVFGCGGVGLNAIQGCAIAGARIIVAVDTSDAKLEMAKQFGATHTQREEARRTSSRR
jgi:Zn-dependent alcohol dehydrogenase